MITATLPDVRVLGPPRVIVDGAVTAVPAGRQSQVLAHLVVRRGEVVSVDRLTDALWGDALPGDPANALQYVVARLRRLLDPHRRGTPTIDRAGAGYVLRLPGAATDVGRLDRAVSHDDVDLEALDDVVTAWTGVPFAAFPDDLVLRAEGERLTRLHLTALARWGVAAVEGGRIDAAVTRLSAAASTPWGRLDEGVHRALATARVRGGDRAAALDVLDGLATRLADELGLDPSPVTLRLRDEILRDEHPRGASSRPAPDGRTVHRVPASVDATVARGATIGDVVERLLTGRLVTITGPPGVGKSRVAHDVARRLEQDGVVVAHASLTDVRDPQLVGVAVLTALGAPEHIGRDVDDVLVDALDDEGLVLLLDGAEHLLPALADRVATWLGRAGVARVLVTSTARLDVRGEQVVALRPLEVPPEGGDAAGSPAVALFCRRAAALDPAFRADADTLRDVGRLVRAVDGLPLAIELAAGRARVLGVGEVADRLGATLDVLGRGERDRPSRHRTLASALDWSLDLLEPEDRAVFEAIAPFASVDLATVEEVAGGDAVDALVRLVDRSLVQRTADGRFAVLRALRTHTWGRLPDRRREEVVGRFVTWATTLVRHHSGRLRGAGQLESLGALDREVASIRNALTITSGLGGDLDAALVLVEGMSRYWDWRGRFAEANHWFDRVSAALEATGRRPSGAVLAWSAFAALQLGEEERAHALVDEAIATGWEESWMRVPGGLIVRAVVNRRVGDLDAAVADAQEVLDIGVREGQPWTQAWAHDALAHTAAASGDVDVARAHAEKSLALFTAAGDERGRAWAMTALADAARVAGDAALAASSARAALDASLAVDDAHGVAWALDLLADAAPDEARADRLRGAAAHLRAEPVTADEGPAVREGRRAAAAGGVPALLAALDDGDGTSGDASSTAR